MKRSGPPPSRLLPFLVRALEDCNRPGAARRRSAAGGEAQPPEIPPESAWQRFEGVRTNFERELAFADSYLADDPPRSRIQRLLASSSELRRMAILQRFIERAYSFRLAHPREGLGISDDLIAWTKEDRSPLAAVIRSRALMERGNFLRILGDPGRAREALALAASELEAKGTGDPLELARHEELLGTLERDCGNFDAAARLLKKALARVRRWGDPYTLQRVLVATAINDHYRGRLKESDALLDESLRISEPDSLFMRFAVINKVMVEYCAGKPHRAYKTLLRVQDGLGPSWLRGFPQDNQMRVLWTEAQVLNSLRLNEEAIGRLKTVREFFIQADQGSKVGHVSVELVLSHAARERHAEVRRELAFGLRFCSGRSVLDRTTREALLLLQGTLDHQGGRLDTDQIRSINHRLDRLHRAPLQAWNERPFADLQL